MAVKTIWPTIDVCGRSVGRGLVANRAECARWLANIDVACTWRAAQTGAGDSLHSPEWLEFKLAEAAGATAKSEQPVGVPPLDLSENAVASGRRARHATMTGAYDTLVATGGVDDEQRLRAIEEAARMIRALWRIDSRDLASEEAVHVVLAAHGTAASMWSRPPGAAAVATQNDFA